MTTRASNSCARPISSIEDARAPAEGSALDELLGHYAERLTPEAADGDLRELASVVTVLARAHFDEQEGRA
ncbi:hypothetical protein GBF35_27125 [Nonomuraea phyllanthi]|uniref:hypothetical protein n=1 Tax=Nonomuraea phyllanthi TaxID=2219224 RepID=UPI0012934BBE|nr:hypothetical protein [Nonomuraea phyllanthi]QFY09834.1 hypothetical protein GBF35_27125 [Nonomuraea phyllanthi]